MDDILFSSSSDEWATPQPLFEQIEETFGPFDLDPCARPETAKAPCWYGHLTDGAFIDGLDNVWSIHGRRGLHAANVFVNPPFCRKKKMYAEPWIEKAFDEIQLGNAAQVVLLIPARTDTKVWHHTVFPHADFIAFIKGRVMFDGPSAGGQSATFPSAIVVFRRQPGAGKFAIPPHVTTWEQRR